MLKILLIEDEFIIARDIKTVLEKDNYAQVFIARNLEGASQIYNAEDVGLVISDVNLNLDIDGVEIVSELIKIKEVPVVYLTAYSDTEIVNRAEKTSPFAYLLKPYNENQLKVTINLSILNFKKVKENVEVNNENLKLIELLTKREKEILLVLATGKISKEIAQELNISVQTVEQHKKNIKTKLNLRNVADMVHFTMKTKLFQI